MSTFKALVSYFNLLKNRFFLCSDFLVCPDPLTASDNQSSTRPAVVVWNKPSNKHEPVIVETKKRENFSKNLFNTSKKLKEELGVSLTKTIFYRIIHRMFFLKYDPTYTEILIGQTRDQRHMTEQARRYLSCSSLNNYTT